MRAHPCSQPPGQQRDPSTSSTRGEDNLGDTILREKPVKIDKRGVEALSSYYQKIETVARDEELRLERGHRISLQNDHHIMRSYHDHEHMDLEREAGES